MLHEKSVIDRKVLMKRCRDRRKNALPIHLFLHCVIDSASVSNRLPARADSSGGRCALQSLIPHVLAPANNRRGAGKRPQFLPSANVVANPLALSRLPKRRRVLAVSRHASYPSIS